MFFFKKPVINFLFLSLGICPRRRQFWSRLYQWRSSRFCGYRFCVIWNGPRSIPWIHIQSSERTFKRECQLPHCPMIATTRRSFIYLFPFPPFPLIPQLVTCFFFGWNKYLLLFKLEKVSFILVLVALFLIFKHCTVIPQTPTPWIDHYLVLDFLWTLIYYV